MLGIFRHKICEINYKRKVKQLRNKNAPINIVFLSFENEKWGYQSLYDLFAKDKRFNPIVLVGITSYKHNEKKDTQLDLENNYNFFKSRGINVEYIYKDNKYIDLQTFKPDIVFYEQQWGLPKKLRPLCVSRYALTCYSAYSLNLFNYKNDYMQKFHSYLYKFFVDSDCNIERYETYKKGNSQNCVSVGYAKLDKYLENVNVDTNKYWRESEKFKIIYSPHHSFEKKGLKMATFKDNGEFILNLARNNPNTTWIFKPHPRLKYALIHNNIMTEDDVLNYYKEWAKIGNIYTQGDYIDIFRTSDLMITDCCSFLGEYLPTGKPLIRLLNKDSIDLNLLGKEVVKGYYQVSDNDELEKTFNKLVFDKNDTKKEIRIGVQKHIIDFNQKSSEKIVNKIKKLI